MGLRGLSLVRQLERKEEMRAYPLDVECLVQWTTSMKHWPVFSDKGRGSPLVGSPPRHFYGRPTHTMSDSNADILAGGHLAEVLATSIAGA
jgi:hypothetical protein